MFILKFKKLVMTCIINCPPRCCHVISDDAISLFWWWLGFEPLTCIYYELSLPTELSSRGHHLKIGDQTSRKIKIVRPKIGFYSFKNRTGDRLGKGSGSLSHCSNCMTESDESVISLGLYKKFSMLH